MRIILISLILGAGPLTAAPLNNLYFGLDNMRGFAEVYWWFTADGRVLRNTLPAGLTRAGFDAACQSHSGSCGDYSLTGDKLTIRYKTGAAENWTYKTLNGGIQLNYLILTPVGKYPAGTHLNGKWDRASTVKGPNMTITAPSFYAFRPDGTFSYLSITGLETESRVKGASVSSSQQAQATGTYSVHDNVLMLMRNGKNEEHMIFPAPGDNLNIDGIVYMKH